MRMEAASALLGKYPPRAVPETWEATALSRAALTGRLLAPPYAETPWSLRQRRLSLRRFLDWLEQHPGDTWQQRWLRAVGVAGGNSADWRPAAADWLAARGDAASRERLLKSVTLGLGQMIYCEALRPGLAWVIASPIQFPLSRDMPRLRDSGGFARLEECAGRAGISDLSRRRGVEQLSAILAAKGGTLADITVGDCLEFMETRDAILGDRTKGRGNSFYQLLHMMGLLPPDAPATLRMLNPNFRGQLTTAELIGQYDLACIPVRDLLTGYLDERQPSVDYATLQALARYLGKMFWKDLETHNPGISSLRLAPDVAIAWKQRLTVKTVTSRDGSGNVTMATSERLETASVLSAVRALYLDIAEWAAEDPARWAQWAVPSPVRREDIRPAKAAGRRKSRMDQRTRERIPVLPILITAVGQARKDTAALLSAAAGTVPGDLFTAGGTTLRRTALTSIEARGSRRTWAEDPVTGARRDLTREENTAFWTWAAVEVLRATGIRIEELIELSHHSLVQYRLPSTGELIPLLHIAPSKTDIERLLVISPELADVLATVIARVRNSDGDVPLVVAYDIHEREFTPPMPVLFQHRVGADSRPLSSASIRNWITGALEGTGITDASGQPLAFKPHDFRRIFATDAIMNGMPPHICQLLMGHSSITTTMGYKAVYPEEAINGHRAFIARRRELRPSEEYRSPTDAEWEEFLGHFERRRLALGDCGRAWGSACIHEHACTRCSLLRVDPAQKPRLEDIRGNLLARIAEAEREGWTGEAEGLKVSLAGANSKLAQIELTLARRAETVSLGIPSYRDAAAATLSPGDRHDH